MQIAFPLTWNLSKINNWKSKEEPFLTNASMFNAGVTWVFWVLNMFCIYVVLFYAFVLVILALVFLVKSGPISVFGYIWKGLKMVVAMLWASITNKSTTEALLR